MMSVSTPKKQNSKHLGMRFQPRDGEILQFIHENEGVVARRHIKAVFWPEKTPRAMERRLLKLFRANYIIRPNEEDYKKKPIPEPICWIGWRGIRYLADQRGVPIELPSEVNETQKREFEKSLREVYDIRWVREPRWSLLSHDLSVVDFKLAMVDAVDGLPNFSIGNWVSEYSFRTKPDRVVYQVKRHDGSLETMEKGVCPDAYFEIVDEIRLAKGGPHKARFLLEVDMATHDNPSFGREKAAPGAAYIRTTPEYEKRFGKNNGRWLIITSGGKTRMNNLMRYTKKYAGEDANLFFFTMFSRMKNINVLTAPIWRQVGEPQPRSLLR